MVRRLRSFVAAFAVAALVAGAAGPASANLEDIDANSVPPMFDLMVLRPVGLVTVGLGAVVFLPAAALTGIFSPRDIGKTYDACLGTPIQFTFRDKLGTH